MYENDVLKFVGHEEGRIRPVGDVNNNITSFAYDYFLKDHLGNVRMVLTEEQQVDHYPTATLEGSGSGSPLSQEQAYYDINSSCVVNKPTNVNPSNLLDYVNDNGTNNPNTFGNKNAVSQKMYRLNAATNRTGYARILRVMGGDKINILAKSYYHYSGGSVPRNNLIGTDIINAFLSVTGGGNAAVQHGATSSMLSGNSTGLVMPLSGFSNDNPDNAVNGVKAGLSYVILDEGFNYVSGGYDPVSIEQAGGLKNHFLQDIEIPKNGYIYIYCSNESNIDVFFDNLEVIHIRGPILEENHYYSYGLKIAAISSKAAGSLQNSYLYQGDFSEFDEDAGYNEFYLRHYDPQIGRWTTTDPYEQFANPYLGMGNSPGGMVDPDGGSIFNIWELGALNHLADAAVGALMGGIIGGIDNGWQGAKRGMAIGGGLGLGAGFVNWSTVGGALGSAGNWVWNLFQSNTYWLLYNGTRLLVYQGKYGSKHVSMVANYPATSGLPNHQNSNEQGNSDLGPLPERNYKINLKPDFTRNAPTDSNGETQKSTGVEVLPWGNGFLYSGWGQWRARLEALPGTDLLGRDGLFYIHDSYKGYTHGCIETNTALYYDLSKVRKTQSSIKVRIKYYPGQNSSTLGNTQQFPPPWWDGSKISYDANGIPYPRAAAGKFPDPTKM